MPRIEENGQTINYGEAGEGPVLVLLHAAGSTGAQWRGVLGELDDKYTPSPRTAGVMENPRFGPTQRHCCTTTRPVW